MNLIKQEAVVLSSAKEFLRAASTEFEKRFWSKVSGFGDACWIWQGSIALKGYGSLTLNGKLILAHRAAYQLVFGPIPVGKMVIHSCDTRPCVNPCHLRAGTHADNMSDMKIRGRNHGGKKRYWRNGIDG